MMDSDSTPTCYSCGRALELSLGNVGRGEMCLHCSADVRVCFNCRHYDENSYNDCAEPMAERVVEKNRRNFCDYFSLSSATKGSPGSPSSTREEALKKLDDLFKK